MWLPDPSKNGRFVSFDVILDNGFINENSRGEVATLLNRLELNLLFHPLFRHLLLRGEMVDLLGAAKCEHYGAILFAWGLGTATFAS